jgi:arginine N-succinyltransferase
MNQTLLRPIRESDLPAVIAMAGAEEAGLTTLPNDPTFLAQRLAESVVAFRPSVSRPGDQVYLFGLEDVETGQVVGLSGIAAKVGGFDPFYSYEIRRERHRHAPLGVERDFEVLHLVREHSGPSEICSLYLRPEWRRGGHGRLLSLARFLFLAAFPERFEQEVISELRGVSRPDGQAPFWEAVGAHFFDSDFRSADFRSGLGNKAFIADLMPSHPIYSHMLEPEAQKAIAQVHDQTRPARALLDQEGFRFGERVDIFDAGPLVRAPVSEIRTVRERRRGHLAGTWNAESFADASPHLVANLRLDFRATTGRVDDRGDTGLWLDARTARRLNLCLGDEFCYAPLRPTPRRP